MSYARLGDFGATPDPQALIDAAKAVLKPTDEKGFTFGLESSSPQSGLNIAKRLGETVVITSSAKINDAPILFELPLDKLILPYDAYVNTKPVLYGFAALVGSIPKQQFGGTPKPVLPGVSGKWVVVYGLPASPVSGNIIIRVDGKVIGTLRYAFTLVQPPTLKPLESESIGSFGRESYATKMANLATRLGWGDLVRSNSSYTLKTGFKKPGVTAPDPVTIPFESIHQGGMASFSVKQATPLSIKPGVVSNNWIYPSDYLPAEVRKDIEDFYNINSNPNAFAILRDQGYPDPAAEAVNRGQIKAQFPMKKLMGEWTQMLTHEKRGPGYVNMTDKADLINLINGRTPVHGCFAVDATELAKVLAALTPAQRAGFPGALKGVLDRISEQEIFGFNAGYLAYLIEGGSPGTMINRTITYYNNEQRKAAKAAKKFTPFDAISMVLSFTPAWPAAVAMQAAQGTMKYKAAKADAGAAKKSADVMKKEAAKIEIAAKVDQDLNGNTVGASTTGSKLKKIGAVGAALAAGALLIVGKR